MAISDDAKLQAAAMIVAAQISAKVFDTDMRDDEVLASALEGAIGVVNSGIERFAASKRAARKKKPSTGKFVPLKAPRSK